MANVTLLHYNNYFNRIVKKEASYADYLTASPNYNKTTDINFVPGDGVSTSLVLGTSSLVMGYDYLIVTEVESSVEVIKSRWFIMEDHRTRDGQYELILRRDVIVDNFGAIEDAPIYVEKANITDVHNPLLFNKEGLQVNQIKQAEFPIKDETECGWVVGYIPRDAFETNTPIDSDVYLPGAADITVNGLSNWAYWKNIVGLNPNGEYMIEDRGEYDAIFKAKARYTRTIYSSGTTTYFSARNSRFPIGKEMSSANTYSTTAQSGTERGEPAVGALPSWYESWSGLEWKGVSTQTQAQETGMYNHAAIQIMVRNIYNNSTFKGYVKTYLDNKGLEFGSTAGIRGLDTKVIYDSSTKLYYRINIKNKPSEDFYEVNTGATGGSNVINYFNNNLVRTGLATYSYTFNGNINSGEFYVRPSGTLYYIELEQLAYSLRVEIDNNRSHLEDASYDMFCIPYSDSYNLYYGDPVTTVVCNKAVALTMATAIGAQAGTNSIYDIQLLPYCPCREAIVRSSDPSVGLTLDGVSYDLIKFYDSDEQEYGAAQSAIIWCTKSIFDVDINAAEIGSVTNISGPFSDIIIPPPPTAAIKTENFYTLYEIPNTPSSASIYRTAIGTTSTENNNLVWVLKSDKNTGEVIESDYYSTIEVLFDHENNTSSLHIYKDNHYQNPEILISATDYTNASYYYTFYIYGTNYGGQNTSELYNHILKVPKIGYFHALLDNAEDIKISNECDLYRLVSGNYNGIFEFSIAKSDGIDGFRVECNYKPWSPYIHVFPKLKNLYGPKFVELDDARGLICGGDFSLTQLSNAWANYQLQNKTYQEMFDRQIKNMDVNNSIAMQQAQFQAGAGMFSGAAGGAASGAIAGAKGGPYAAAAGAIIGGATGLGMGIAGGVMDVQNLAAQQAENRQYAIDMYNYNLQNIQAIPTSITKTTALTYNTRIWPFLEYYTCTDVEKQALRDKLKYNGMTVMATGKLSDYISEGEPHFFLGQLIRIPDLAHDNHMANEIYNELLKGVFI